MIKIEVTGTSIGEVADKLLAIGSSLRATTAVEYKHTEIKGNVTFTPEHPDFERLKEVAEEAPVDPTSAAEVTQASSAPDTTPESVSLTSDSGPTATETASPSDTLDFDTEVAPFVLQVVKEKGKPVAQDILSQFGVEKASLLDPAQWPELVATLKGAL